MNEQELKFYVAEIKRQLMEKPENKGKPEEEIEAIMLDGWYDAFLDGKLSATDIMAFAEELGYEPTEEFLNSVKEQGLL